MGAVRKWSSWRGGAQGVIGEAEHARPGPRSRAREGHLLFYPGIGVQLLAELGQKRSAHWEPFGVRCRWGVSTISLRALSLESQTRDLRSRSQVDLP